MTEAAETETETPPVTVGACYPELAGDLTDQLKFLDVDLARASADWHEIVDMLTNIALGELHRPFSALVPTIDAWSRLDIADETTLDRISVVPLANRTRHVLQRNHLETWGDVARMSPAIVGGFVNAGEKVVRDATRLAIELGAAAVVGLSDGPPTLIPLPAVLFGNARLADAAVLVPSEAIQRLASWGRTQHDLKTLGDVFDRVVTNTTPSDIADAYAELRDTPLLLTDSPPPPLAELVAELLGEMSDVETSILRQRIFANTPVTLEKIGIDIGVTRERVRQIQVRAESRLEAQLAGDRFAPLRWAAHEIRQALGTLAPVENAESVIARRCADLSPEDALVASTILRRYAGPYRVERQVFITDEATEIAERLSAACDQHGVVPRVVADSAFADCGVRAEFFNAALAWVQHFKQFGDVLVEWPNNGVDKLVAMLALRGQPADTETLITECGEDYSARALHNRLGEDPRVVRVSRREWGLIEWGLEEYSGITEEIVERIERGGGRARLAAVVREVAEFGVRESSVRMYSEAPMFVIEGDWIRLRSDEERVRADDPFVEARRSYHLGATSIAFLVDVDSDVLRGSGGPLPRGTSVALGVQPGDKVTFTGENGDVVVSWPLTSTMGPSIGSLRSHAQHHQLGEGDHLRVIFDTETGTVTSFGIPAAALQGKSDSERASALTGIDGLAGGNTAVAIAAAVQSPVQTLRRALAGRGDDELALLLPRETTSPELNDALTDLARALGE